MSNFVVWRHLSMKPGGDKQVLAALTTLTKYARDNGDAVIGIWVWQQAADSSTGVLPWVYGETQHQPFTGSYPAIMTQEIYRGESDYSTLLESTAYQSFVAEAWPFLQEEPREQRLKPAAGFSFRPGNPYSTHEDLYVVAARIQYKEGTVPQGVDCWKTVTSFVEENEKQGTLGYCFLTDEADPAALYSIEAYRDVAAFDVHKVRDAVVNNRHNQVENLKIRTGLNIRVFKQALSSFD